MTNPVLRKVNNPTLRRLLFDASSKGSKASLWAPSVLRTTPALSHVTSYNNNIGISCRRSFASKVPPIQDEAKRIGMTADERAKYYAAGIIDERALINFDTLHEMQTRACHVFSPKNLFSTYSPESKQFEWMTYQECTFSFKK